MSQVNSYGHGGTVSSPNHTFSWASLNKQLTSTSCTYFRLWLTATLLEWYCGREENDRRNCFMINLHKSMGLGWNRTRDPWICSQTRICCQTRYRLRYVARYKSKLKASYVTKKFSVICLPVFPILLQKHPDLDLSISLVTPGSLLVHLQD